MIAIIDYGLGNIRAFASVYKNLNIPHIIASQTKDLENASKIILPGVGSFDYAMQRLEESGLRNLLDDLILKQRIPILGICVGMQMLANSSEEGKLNGLGWVDGEVKRFNHSLIEPKLLIPHMGWNNIKPVKTNKLLYDLDDTSRFYYLHSYYFRCNNSDDIIALTEYGDTFACAVNHENVFGVQFHPEKSHQWGIQVLKNFAEL